MSIWSTYSYTKKDDVALITTEILALESLKALRIYLQPKID